MGILIYLDWYYAGIAMEAVADYQKHVFRLNKSNDDKWCDVGVWSWCRYPNCKLSSYN
ncbi:DUF1295 domain-containing protein [archaeon]|nr:MAG: DUF1295 domain-containing protein [archaeon]